jgi:purine-binding chemotaxis protein CheW
VAIDTPAAYDPRGKGIGVELLSVQVGAQDFALDIMSVREIRGWVPSTALPHAPTYIKGMINLRGVVMAIVGLADRLGLPSREPGPASVVVVVEVGARTFGVLVDAVNDIITVTNEMRQATPDTGTAACKSVVEGLVTIDTRIVSIISISAIMPEVSDLKMLDAA